MPLCLRAPLHPLPSAINLSSVHSKTSIFHSNSNEDISSTVWDILGNFGQLRPKIWYPNVARKMVLTTFWRHPGIPLMVILMKRQAYFLLLPKKYSPIVAPPPLSLPGKCADQLGCSPDPLQTFPQSNLQLCSKYDRSAHIAQSISLTEQKSHQGPFSVVNKIYIS